MPTKLLFLLLALVAFAGPRPAIAQGSSADGAYEQAKLAIWCETVVFIYHDYGADSLVRRLDCNNWEIFRQSLRPNYLQSLTFFQAIERPEIYAGYSTNEAKLSKLVDEIGRKLKSSSTRQNNPSRLQAVDSLQRELLQLAQNEALFVNSDMGQEELEAKEQPRKPQAAQTTLTDEDTEDVGISWWELLQWLLIAMLIAATAALWVQNKKLKREVGIRMARRKQEIAGLAQKNVRKAQPEPQLSKGLNRSEVLQLIRSEQGKLQKQLQVDNRPKEIGSSRQDKVRQAGEVPKPAEQPRQPEPQSTGREAEEIPVPEKNGEPANPGIYYDKLPFKGGFHHNQLSRQRNPDSIYSIEVLGRHPDEAEFWVTEDADIQKYAMENGLSFFEEACEYDQVEENPSRVRNLEKGRLRKKGHLWEIEKKVKVSFE